MAINLVYLVLGNIRGNLRHQTEVNAPLQSCKIAVEGPVFGIALPQAKCYQGTVG